MLLNLTNGKYLPIVKQLNLALKISLFERELFTFATARRHFQRVRSNKCQLGKILYDTPLSVRRGADSDLPIRQLNEHSRTLSNKTQRCEVSDKEIRFST